MKLREGNIFTPVYDSVHGEGALPDRDPSLWTETPPRYGKERAVCILLECILIWQFFCRKLRENERNWSEEGTHP